MWRSVAAAVVAAAAEALETSRAAAWTWSEAWKGPGTR